jgi:hypothetical protein
VDEASADMIAKMDETEKEHAELLKQVESAKDANERADKAEEGKKE